jgi:hypothetical protein
LNCHEKHNTNPNNPHFYIHFSFHNLRSLKHKLNLRSLLFSPLKVVTLFLIQVTTKSTKLLVVVRLILLNTQYKWFCVGFWIRSTHSQSLIILLVLSFDKGIALSFFAQFSFPTFGYDDS